MAANTLTSLIFDVSRGEARAITPNFRGKHFQIGYYLYDSGEANPSKLLMQVTESHDSSEHVGMNEYARWYRRACEKLVLQGIAQLSWNPEHGAVRVSRITGALGELDNFEKPHKLWFSLYYTKVPTKRLLEIRFWCTDYARLWRERKAAEATLEEQREILMETARKNSTSTST